MTALDHLLDALTTAAETGHGYVPARRAVVEYVQRIAADLDQARAMYADMAAEAGRFREQVNALRKAMKDVAADLADGERLT